LSQLTKCWPGAEEQKIAKTPNHRAKIAALQKRALQIQRQVDKSALVVWVVNAPERTIINNRFIFSAGFLLLTFGLQNNKIALMQIAQTNEV